MKEPDVTLTDFALALECAVFCAILLRGPYAGALRKWWAFFFAAVGTAALIGGLVHGFFPDSRALWVATLLTLGVASVSAWSIGSHLIGVPWIRVAGMILFVAYVAVVAFVSRVFLVAIAMYLPATLFLLVAVIAMYLKERSRPLALGITGLVLTFVAAAIQQLKVGLHPVYFNHNALYHLVQFVALWLVFIAAMRTSRAAAS